MKLDAFCFPKWEHKNPGKMSVYSVFFTIIWLFLDSTSFHCYSIILKISARCRRLYLQVALKGPRHLTQEVWGIGVWIHLYFLLLNKSWTRSNLFTLVKSPTSESYHTCWVWHIIFHFKSSLTKSECPELSLTSRALEIIQSLHLLSFSCIESWSYWGISFIKPSSPNQ